MPVLTHQNTTPITTRAAAAAVGLGLGFSGHSGRVGMAQGCWKTARMVEVYTRSEEAGRAAKWLA